MVISPRPSHSFGIFVVWDNVVVVRKPLVADGAYAVLVGNFPLQKFAHFSRGPEFPISPRVMWVLNTLNAQPYHSSFLPDGFPATAEE